MVIAMVETLIGVEASAEIAGVDGVDAVFVASGDLGSFSGMSQGDPDYEALVDKIKSGIESHGKYAGGPSAWMQTREGYQFFQGPSTGSLIRIGTRVALEEADPCRFLPSGAMPVAGENPCP